MINFYKFCDGLDRYDELYAEMCMWEEYNYSYPYQHILHLIRSNADNAYRYAHFAVKGRWIEGESSIMTNSVFSYFYAKDVVKGVWPEGEPAIMKDPDYAYYYAKHILKGRWPEAEPYIKQDEQTWQCYDLHILNPDKSGYIDIISTDKWWDLNGKRVAI